MPPKSYFPSFTIVPRIPPRMTMLPLAFCVLTCILEWSTQYCVQRKHHALGYTICFLDVGVLPSISFHPSHWSQRDLFKIQIGSFHALVLESSPQVPEWACKALCDLVCPEFAWCISHKSPHSLCCSLSVPQGILFYRSLHLQLFLSGIVSPTHDSAILIP